MPSHSAPCICQDREVVRRGADSSIVYPPLRSTETETDPPYVNQAACNYPRDNEEDNPTPKEEQNEDVVPSTPLCDPL